MHNKTATKDFFQKIIESQFNKVSNVNIDNFVYRIAITRDQIPSIKEIKFKDDCLIITFEDITDFKKISNIINRNKNGLINYFKIEDVKSLKNPVYKRKLLKELLTDINGLPENNKDQILNKHKEKKLVKAISEIISTVPESVL